MSLESNIPTINVIVQNESFELSSSLFHQVFEHSLSNDFDTSKQNKQHQFYLNVNPFIFNAYLLYIQSGYFVQLEYSSREDLIDGLSICGAPFALINHFKNKDLTEILSSNVYSYHPIDNKNKTPRQLFSILMLIGLSIAGCSLTIDLYRQMMMLNKNSYETGIPQVFILIIYIIDGILLLCSSVNAIAKLICSDLNRKQLRNDPDFLTDIISCLGILLNFIVQRPISDIYLSNWNLFWIFIQMCRTIRVFQLGYRLIDIQLCFYAITRCIWTYLQTVTGLFWIFIFSGSMLYTLDMIENNEQYSNIRLTIFSAHETLYMIGYRNNPPNGVYTRLWTIISIYLMSPIAQIILWFFQTKVTIQWKNLSN